MIIRPRTQARNLASSGQPLSVTVASLAELKELVSRPASVITQYRATAGDQGGGVWVWRSGDQSANVLNDSLSGVWAAPSSASTGASGAWQRAYTGAVNPRWFGAVGDGSANDTDPIQKALDFVVAAGRGAVHLTAGAYKITSTITISSDNITLRGDGIAATFIYVTQLTTDGIKFTTSGTNQNGCLVQDIGIYHIGTDPTAGALLHFDRQTNFAVSNVSLFNGFCCAQFESTGHGNIVNLNAQADGNFTAYRAGSSIVAFTKHASGALPFEMHFTNCDWRGQTNNNRLHYAVFVTGCDGLWFDSCHFGMARIGVFLNPATNSTQLTAVNISNCYLDTCSEYGFLALEPSGSYSGIFGDHHLEFAQIYGCAVGVAWNCATTDWNTIKGGQWFQSTTNAVELAKGSRVSIFGADISKVNEGGGGGSGIDIDQFTLFRIADVSVTRNGGTNAPSYGIYIRSGASDFIITGFRAKDCGVSLSDNSGAVTKHIGPYMSDTTFGGTAEAAANWSTGYVVTTLAALKALTARPATVTNQYRATAGDGGGGTWVWRSGNQSSKVSSDTVSGLWAAPDSDNTGASGAWQRAYSGDADARWFGAVGDDSTDNYTALNAASTALAAFGGGVIYLPPTGAAYKITDTVTLNNGVKLKGAGTIVYPGDTATNSQWTAQGSWLHPTHTSNSAVKLSGNGSAIEGVNFIHTQTAPSGSFSPTTYGWCIEVIGTTAHVENIRIINASHGIWWHYTDVSGGGTNCWMKDVIISAFTTRLKTTCVNDVMHWSDIQCRGLWYESDSYVVAHIRANTKGWDCGYTDNIMVDGIQFFEDRGILFTDETCLSITHSMYNGTINNVLFGLSQRSLQVASTSTTVRCNFGTVIAQQGNAFGYTWSDTMFALASDNVDITFASLTVVDAGGIVFTLGNGTGGKVKCGVLDIQNYSSVAASQAAIVMGADSRFDAGVVPTFYKNGSAGARVSGSGSGNFTTARMQSWNVFSVFGQYTGVAGTGSYADISTDNFLIPGVARVYQARLQGEVNVTSASAATTGTIKLTGVAACVTSAFSTATTGFKSFDTGWVDITEAELSALGTLGRVQHNMNAAVAFSTSNMNILVR